VLPVSGVNKVSVSLAKLGICKIMNISKMKMKDENFDEQEQKQAQ